MYRGYVSIWRKLRKSFLWEDKPFAMGQAFIDLILLANHQDKEVFFHRRVEKCMRGQVITSILKLSKYWGWSQGKVKRFLDLCQKTEKLKYTIKKKRFIKITLCNYYIYQTNQKKDGEDKFTKTEKRRRRDGEETEINNNYNNYKKNIYSLKNENEKYLFDKWNSLKITRHREFEKFKPCLTAKLNHYSKAEIEQGFQNYAIILASDKHYFSHRWTLYDFLTRKNGFDKFLPANNPFETFKNFTNKEKNTNDDGYR